MFVDALLSGLGSIVNAVLFNVPIHAHVGQLVLGHRHGLSAERTERHLIVEAMGIRTLVLFEQKVFAAKGFLATDALEGEKVCRNRLSTGQSNDYQWIEP